MNTEVYSSRSFPLKMSKIEEGTPLFDELPTGSFNFHWNARTREGQAQLLYLNEMMLAVTLYPAMENNFLVFTSKMQPTTYNAHRQPIVLNKIILKIDLENDIRSAALVFNHKGDVRYTTANYHQMDSAAN